MKNPKVSVVLPTYNRDKFVKQSILSVLNQSFQGLEIVVIDDGSTDNTENVIKSIIDDRIRYIKNENNIGVTKSLNRGVELARGKYIARIDDQDEWIDKDKLKKQIEFLEKNKDHVLVGTGAVVVNMCGNEIYRYLKPLTDSDIRKKMLFKNCFIHPTVVFRKDIACEVGMYDNTILVGQDYDLWLRLGVSGKLANLNDYAINYVNDNESISSKKKVAQIKQNFSFIKKYKKYYSGYIRATIRNFLRLIIYGYMNNNFIKKITSRFSK